ncbi:unnamed protein product [Owenia fusiformis]|uniref:Large ribosomal subunit protein uL10m n=1 Tax=Owenia fusiformis TaxID=6347 RepID=A0A8J1XPB7_OWEFU|nr:unnamed protein product [Owenia fusiformis]
MAALMKRNLYVTPWAIVRHKVNLKGKPRPTWYERSIVEKISVPLMPRAPVDYANRCGKLNNQRQQLIQDHPYQDFLIRRCKEMFEKNSMVAVFQQLSASRNEQNKNLNKFRKKGFTCHHFNNLVVKRSIADTKWANMAPLFVSSTFFIASEEAKVKDLVQASKKVTDFVLLGAVADDRLFSKQGLMDYAALPDIETKRAELVGILNHAASNTKSLLERHQQTLSTSLGQFIKQNTQSETLNESNQTETKDGGNSS